MRRLARISFGVATVLSIIVGAAVLFMWPVSYRWDDEAEFRCGKQLFVLRSNGGLARFVWDSNFPGSEAARWERKAVGTKDGIRYHGDSDPFHGIEWHYKTGEQGGAVVTWRVLTVPYYGLFMLSLALPVMRGLMFMRRRRARRRPGCCVVCGYDLRATPERCPECGAAAGKII